VILRIRGLKLDFYHSKYTTNNIIKMHATKTHRSKSHGGGGSALTAPLAPFPPLYQGCPCKQYFANLPVKLNPHIRSRKS
jgi:hypothetical protein